MMKKSYSWTVGKALQVAIFTALLATTSGQAAENNGNHANVIIAQVDTNTHFEPKQQTMESSSCTAYFKGTINVNNCRAGEVPLPAASWLFVLALIAFVGLSNKRKI